MTAAVFDTNILIDLSKGIITTKNAITSYTNVMISAITWSEFMVGISPERWEQANSFINENYEIIHTTDDICAQAVQARHQYRLKLPNALIYTTAISMGVPLVTRNSKDFNEQMPGVRVIF